MKSRIASIAASRSARYVAVALLSYTLASPIQAFAIEGGLGALEQRVAAAEAAIQSLQTAVTSVLAQANQYTDQQVAAEAAARQAADVQLQANIDAEAAVRAAADATLQGNINAEATARANGDASTLASAKAYTDAKPVGTLSATVVRGPLVLLCALGDPTCSSTAWATASCPSGDVATGGGWDNFGENVLIEVSRPDPLNVNPPTGWAVYGANQAIGVGKTFRATVVCVKVAP